MEELPREINVHLFFVSLESVCLCACCTVQLVGKAPHVSSYMHQRGYACLLLLIVFTTTKIGIRYGGGWHPSSVSQGLHDVEFSLQVHVLLFWVKLFALRQLRPHLGGRHVQSWRTVSACTLKQRNIQVHQFKNSSENILRSTFFTEHNFVLYCYWLKKSSMMQK